MILLIDNYDSFSYNLYQLIGGIDPDVVVVRNDAMTADEMLGLGARAIVISPGPGRPEAGTVLSCIASCGLHDSTVPVLGVCLGHQAICQAFGAEITYAKELMHGKQSVVSIDTKCPIFKGCAPLIKVARYHSLAAAPETIPDCLQITALCSDGEVMGVWHKELDIFGVQFHPESILTPDGERIMRNFLEYAEMKAAAGGEVKEAACKEAKAATGGEVKAAECTEAKAAANGAAKAAECTETVRKEEVGR